MAKLTDSQLIVLSKAAARNDGVAVLPDHLSKAAAFKVGSSLIARKLMREVRSKPGMPIWRTDEDDRPFSLVILKAGREAIGVDNAKGKDDSPAANSSRDRNSARQKKASGTNRLPDLNVPPASSVPRTGSKQAQMIAMLSRSDGATIDELVGATGWLAHTTRAVMTGLRKRGYQLDRQRQDGVTHYWIKGSPEVHKAA